MNNQLFRLRALYIIWMQFVKCRGLLSQATGSNTTLCVNIFDFLIMVKVCFWTVFDEHHGLRSFSDINSHDFVFCECFFFLYENDWRNRRFVAAELKSRVKVKARHLDTWRRWFLNHVFIICHPARGFTLSIIWLMGEERSAPNPRPTLFQPVLRLWSRTPRSLPRKPLVISRSLHTVIFLFTSPFIVYVFCPYKKSNLYGGKYPTLKLTTLPWQLRFSN